MIKVYLFLIIMGVLGVVGYGGYMYYKDTQQRIATLTANNAKLETAVQISEQSIATLQSDIAKNAELNRSLQNELQTAETYGDQLRDTLRKHNLTHLANKKPVLIERKMQNATNRYGLVLLTSLTLMSCSLMPEPKVVTVTKTVKTQVPIVARPKQVHLNDVKIYVVSKVNYKEFVAAYAKKNGADSYIALSVKDYENLALNFAELRRYIEQQKQIIVYYENAVAPEKKEEKNGKIQ